MMQANKHFNEKRVVFNNRAVDIGNTLFEVYGAQGLFDAMRGLCDRVLYTETEHQDYYFTDLRELEFKWTGITDEFQC